MENVCLTITSWEIPCMNPVSYTQEWWLCSFSTNFLSCLSGQRTNSVLHQKYLECNKLLLKKKTRRNCRNSNCLQVMRLLEQTGHSMISRLSFTKIASCRVYAISRRGIEQKGSSFGFILGRQAGDILIVAGGNPRPPSLSGSPDGLFIQNPNMIISSLDLIFKSIFW